MPVLTVEACATQSEQPLPAYAHPGDAGLDLRAAIDGELAPFERLVVPCGFSLAIPEGYAGLVMPRSGLAARHGISVVNAPGLIDSGYRGEIQVILVNMDPRETFAFKVGDRIAQLVIVAVPAVELAPVENLSSTERGEGGFGSSGVR